MTDQTKRARIAASLDEPFVDAARTAGRTIAADDRDVIDRDVLARFPGYGDDGCVCGNVATPDPFCSLHFAIAEMERLESRIRAYRDLTTP